MAVVHHHRIPAVGRPLDARPVVVTFPNQPVFRFGITNAVTALHVGAVVGGVAVGEIHFVQITVAVHRWAANGIGKLIVANAYVTRACPGDAVARLGVFHVVEGFGVAVDNFDFSAGQIPHSPAGGSIGVFLAHHAGLGYPYLIVNGPVEERAGVVALERQALVAADGQTNTKPVAGRFALVPARVVEPDFVPGVGGYVQKPRRHGPRLVEHPDFAFGQAGAVVNVGHAGQVVGIEFDKRGGRGTVFVAGGKVNAQFVGHWKAERNLRVGAAERLRAVRFVDESSFLPGH